MADDYNIGKFGEFDRFEDERAFMPEAFERPQSTIGGYDEQGYTLPAFENENPDNWFWGYNNPDDTVQEQQHGVWPSIKRNSPEWVKDIGKGLHDTGKLFYDHGTYSDDIMDFFGWQPQDNYYNKDFNERFNEDYISDEMSMLGFPGTQVAQSQWKRPDNMEKTIKSLEIRPEFEGWTHDEIKYWLINQARANRGGIIGLL
jgi:hypothetical protein